MAKFRIDLSGTNTTNWTLPSGTGFACDYGPTATWPVAGGSGTQVIHISSAGPARDHTLVARMSLSRRGSLIDLQSTLPMAEGLRVVQHDERHGVVSAPGSGPCLNTSDDFSLGGVDSLCGGRDSEGVQGIGFDVQRTTSNGLVIRHGAVRAGLTTNAVGEDMDGVDDATYYGDADQADCPAPTDHWLDLAAGGQFQSSVDSANFFLPYSHGATGDVFTTIPSFAPFPVKALTSCKVKTIKAHAVARDTTSGPFNWEETEPPPAGWANWTATTTLHWTMTLHRTSCKRRSG